MSMLNKVFLHKRFLSSSNIERLVFSKMWLKRFRRALYIIPFNRFECIKKIFNWNFISILAVKHINTIKISKSAWMATSLQQYNKCIAWRENITKNIIPIYDCKFVEEWELAGSLLRFPAVPGLQVVEAYKYYRSLKPCTLDGRRSELSNWSNFDVFRHEEDGVQDSPVAREVLLLRRVQNTHRNQEFHPTRAGDLLRWMLRREVRYSLREMQQGMWSFRYSHVNCY